VMFLFHRGLDAASGKDMMLNRLLSVRFHVYILLAGIALLTLAILRAYALWRQTKLEGAQGRHHHHGHDHHDHSHDHDHDVEMAVNHAPAHAHSHADHSHADHSHGWAPWRYVVLMVPVILFALGQPASSDQGVLPTHHGDLDLPPLEPESAASLAAPTEDLFSQLALAGILPTAQKTETAGMVPGVEFRRLHESPGKDGERRFLNGKSVLVKGEYMADPDNPRVGYVMRYLRQCCSADAVPVSIPVVGRQALPALTQRAWAHIRVKVDYVPRDGRYQMRLIVLRPQDMQEARQDESVYIDN
jgi:hypothetical protein